MYRKYVILCDYCKEVFGPKKVCHTMLATEKRLRELAEKEKWKKVGPNKDACSYCVREKRYKRK